MEKVFKIGGQFYLALFGQFYAAIDNVSRNTNFGLWMPSTHSETSFIVWS
jgi:hypothetical protein